MRSVKQTTGIYRTPSTVKGVNCHALPSDLVNGYAWVYEDKDGPYSKLLWERRAPTITEAFECGIRCYKAGQPLDDGYYIDENLCNAWVAGYNSVN